jgi:hypothetical protein
VFQGEVSVLRTGGTGILLLSLLGLACGETSDDPGASAGAGTGGVGGSDAEGTGGKASAAGGSNAGGRNASGQGGRGSIEGGTAGSGHGASGGVGEPELSYVDLQGSPLYTRVQRLTNNQWENAVTDLLRLPQRRGLSTLFAPPVAGLSSFDNNEKILFVDTTKFVDFETGAEAAAAIAAGSAEALAAVYAGTDSAGFVREFGRRAFRRPLTPEEETKYQGVFAFGEQLYGSGFANGAALVIRAMLQAPYFLYRTELGPAGDALDPFELASKLSFWLLGTTPSDSLLDAAAAGALSSNEGLEDAARQMLDDPRAVAVMRDFHGQLLHLESMRSISKVGVPEYDTEINPELALSSYTFFDLVFRENLGVREILTSRQAYVSAGLAPFYGLDASASELALRDLGPARSGYFMQVPFLMLGSVNAQSDPSQRGSQLQAAMLCGPPHLTASSVYVDPLGSALEGFDGMGRKHESDPGQPIDTAGTYPFAEGVEAFADGNELMKIMAGSAQVHTCYSKQITGYALGRDVVEGDRPLLESLAKVSLSHSVKELVLALVRDPAFRMRKGGLP